MLKHKVGFMTDTGIKKRKRSVNQDYCYADEDGIGLFVIADGVSGSMCGEEASQTVVDFIADSVKGMDNISEMKDDEIQSRLVEILEEANKHLHTRNKERHPGCREAHYPATTASIALVNKGKVFAAYFGNSRIYRVKSQEENQPEILKNKPGYYAFLGQQEDIKEVGKVSYEVYDASELSHLLLCTDGLTDNALDDEIKDILLQHDAETAAEKLIELSNHPNREKLAARRDLLPDTEEYSSFMNQIGGNDNTTAIVVELKEREALKGAAQAEKHSEKTRDSHKRKQQPIPPTIPASPEAPTKDKIHAGYEVGFKSDMLGKWKKMGNRNQDSFYADDDGIGLFVVADGARGTMDGKKASQTVVDFIADSVKGMDNIIEMKDDEIQSRLVGILREANKYLYETNKTLCPELNDWYYPGTTASIALVNKGRVFAAYFGNSRIYRVKSGADGPAEILKNKLRIDDDRMNFVCEYESESNEIVFAEEVPKENMGKRYWKDVSAVLGIKEDITEAGDVGSEVYDASELSHLLLCTDGLTDLAHDEEIKGILLQHDAETAAEKLIELSKHPKKMKEIADKVMDETKKSIAAKDLEYEGGKLDERVRTITDLIEGNDSATAVVVRFNDEALLQDALLPEAHNTADEISGLKQQVSELKKSDSQHKKITEGLEQRIKDLQNEADLLRTENKRHMHALGKTDDQIKELQKEKGVLQQRYNGLEDRYKEDVSLLNKIIEDYTKEKDNRDNKEKRHSQMYGRLVSALGLEEGTPMEECIQKAAELKSDNDALAKESGGLRAALARKNYGARKDYIPESEVTGCAEEMSAEETKKQQGFFKRLARGIVNHIPVYGSLKTNKKAVDAAIRYAGQYGPENRISEADIWETMYRSGINNKRTKKAFIKELKDNGYEFDEQKIKSSHEVEHMPGLLGKIQRGLNKTLDFTGLNNVTGHLEIYKGDNAWDSFKRNTRISGEVNAIVSAAALAAFGASAYYALGSLAGGIDEAKGSRSYSGALGLVLGALGLASAIGAGSITQGLRSGAMLGAQAAGYAAKGKKGSFAEKASHVLGLGLTASSLGFAYGAVHDIDLTGFAGEGHEIKPETIDHEKSAAPGLEHPTLFDAKAKESLGSVDALVWADLRDADRHGNNNGVLEFDEYKHLSTEARAFLNPLLDKDGVSAQDIDNFIISSLKTAQNSRQVPVMPEQHQEIYGSEGYFHIPKGHKVWHGYSHGWSEGNELRLYVAPDSKTFEIKMDINDILSERDLHPSLREGYDINTRIHSLEDLKFRFVTREGTFVGDVENHNGRYIGTNFIDEQGKSADISRFLRHGGLGHGARYAEVCYLDEGARPGPEDDMLHVFSTALRHGKR